MESSTKTWDSTSLDEDNILSSRQSVDFTSQGSKFFKTAAVFAYSCAFDNQLSTDLLTPTLILTFDLEIQVFPLQSSKIGHRRSSAIKKLDKNGLVSCIYR
jgi:hypothetical protein